MATYLLKIYKFFNVILCRLQCKPTNLQTVQKFLSYSVWRLHVLLMDYGNYACEFDIVVGSKCIRPPIHYLWLYSPCGPWQIFQAVNLYTVGRTPWTGDQPVAPTHITQTRNKHRQMSMPGVAFEPMIPLFKLTKTVHALDRAATMIGRKHTNTSYM
jgi:hypothetical protein